PRPGRAGAAAGGLGPHAAGAPAPTPASLSRARNPSSSRTVTPSSRALSSFEPPPSPATRKSVLALTEPEALAPSPLTSSAASSRLKPGRAPGNPKGVAAQAAAAPAA